MSFNENSRVKIPALLHQIRLGYHRIPVTEEFQYFNTAEKNISRWCTNEIQPSIETFLEIAKLLDVDGKELINSTK